MLTHRRHVRSLVSALMVFVLSVSCAVVRSEPSINVNRSSPTTRSSSSSSSSSSSPSMSRIFDDHEIQAYRRDGFLLVRAGRLLSHDLVERMRQMQRTMARDTIRPKSKYFTMVEQGVMFGGGSSNENAFRTAAIHSKLPQAAAELMGMMGSQEQQQEHEGKDTLNLRVLRDVLLAKDVDECGCDWHVDDQYFWPESFQDYAPSESINVWIALDDMPAEYRGSMALAVGSHNFDWRDEAYEAIGQNRMEDGGRTIEEWKVFIEEMKRTGKGPFLTCSLDLSRPDLKRRFEAVRRVIDLRRGDIIFATRSLFHKTDDVTERGKEYYKSRGMDTLARYSIRYAPGVARIPKGWSMEWSFVTEQSTAGRSLDDIESITRRPWYPKVWPMPDEDIDQRLDRLDKDLERVKRLTLKESTKLFSLTK